MATAKTKNNKWQKGVHATNHWRDGANSPGTISVSGLKKGPFVVAKDRWASVLGGWRVIHTSGVVINEWVERQTDAKRLVDDLLALPVEWNFENPADYYLIESPELDALLESSGGRIAVGV